MPLPTSMIFENKVTEPRRYFLLVDEWNSIRRLPKASTSTTIRMWNIRGRKNENARTLKVLDDQGKLTDVTLEKQRLNFNWVEQFDVWIVDVQKQSKVICEEIRKDKEQKGIGRRWAVAEYNWMRTNTGSYTANSDKREFVPEKGFAFTLKMEIPDNTMEFTEDHVRLRKNRHGKAVILDDAKSAQGNETFLDPGGIYITKATMDKLRTGKYDWTKNSNCVCCRNALGDATWFQCGSDFIRKPEWWEKAYVTGLSAEQPFGGRARDVKNLKLAFVITRAGSSRSVTIESLEKTISQVKEQSSAREIVTDATVFLEEDFNPETYGEYRPLSMSPFGHFETWIKNSDYLAYLRGYQGYKIPNSVNIKTLTTAFGKLKVPTKSSEQSKKWGEHRDQQMKAAGKGTTNENLTVCRVSYETITKASSDDRSSFPQQGFLMGGSATDIAKALDWNTTSRISHYEDPNTKLIWNALGVYASEWLHRTAYSWGNPSGSGMNQSAPNFIFGSSECNSLMTRYEKAL